MRRLKSWAGCVRGWGNHDLGDCKVHLATSYFSATCVRRSPGYDRRDLPTGPLFVEVVVTEAKGRLNSVVRLSPAVYVDLPVHLRASRKKVHFVLEELDHWKGDVEEFPYGRSIKHTVPRSRRMEFAKLDMKKPRSSVKIEPARTLTDLDRWRAWNCLLDLLQHVIGHAIAISPYPHPPDSTKSLQERLSRPSI